VSFFDNVSDIIDSQSDILCRAVTGAGDMKRKLFENDEDVIYNYRRIIGLNGITNAATRADLLDRGIIVEFLMGHSIGLNSNYYRPTYDELLQDYLKAVPALTTNDTNNIVASIKEQQEVKEKEIEQMKQTINTLMSNMASLTEAVSKLKLPPGIGPTIIGADFKEQLAMQELRETAEEARRKLKSQLDR
jgi:hypothetical protein